MKIGIPHGNTIINVAVVDDGDIPSHLVGGIPDVEIGWIYNGAAWVPPASDEE